MEESSWYTKPAVVERQRVRYELTGGESVSPLARGFMAFYAHNDKNIVEILNFNINENVRCQKNGKSIFHKKVHFYKASQFNIIALIAINDGIVAWHRMGFSYFRPIDELRLFKAFQTFYEENNNQKQCPYDKFEDIKSRDFFLKTNHLLPDGI